MGVKKKIVKRQTEEIMVREAFSGFFAEKKIIEKIEIQMVKGQEIILRQTKGKRAQIIPMCTELMFALRKFIRDLYMHSGIHL